MNPTTDVPECEDPPAVAVQRLAGRAGPDPPNLRTQARQDVLLYYMITGIAQPQLPTALSPVYDEKDTPNVFAELTPRFRRKYTKPRTLCIAKR